MAVSGEPKVFASLSSGLLARKGAARPAMRPQGFGQMGGSPEDLGWDDMGFEPPKPVVVDLRDEEHDAFGDELPEQPVRHPLAALTPVQSPVHNQQAEIAGRFAADGEDVDDEAEAKHVDETAEPDEDEIDETAELYDPEQPPEENAFRLKPFDEPPHEAQAITPESLVPAPVSILPIAAPKPRQAPKPRAAPGTKAKAAFTLRLDPQRHLRLRLACAVSGRSAQRLVTDALDELLEAMPELDAMAAKAKRQG